MKAQKKGFTLIELMVVIVIIGILAAIAIPKLFGMSAKAKAQEVPGAAGTYTKMQTAYIIETNKIGGNKQIAYQFPGQTTYSQTSDATGNFTYGVSITSDTEVSSGNVLWTAAAKNSLNDCAAGVVGWTATVDISATVSAVASSNCKPLTPNFENLR